MMNGIIVIDKEPGFTSHDVVAKMRGICGQRKIGHTGTLDPMATGVLPVCLGSATKLCDMLADRDKEYVAELLLGVETDTQDVTGQVLARCPVEVQESQVRSAAASFVGEYRQVPPMYCSKGTYIRTLCADMGERLACGGTMQSLRRTRVGMFSLEDACTLGELQRWKDEDMLGHAGLDQAKLRQALRPVDSVFADCPALHVKQESCLLLDNGNAIAPQQTAEGEVYAKDIWVRMYRPDRSFAGIYAYEPDRKWYRPVKMFLEKE